METKLPGALLSLLITLKAFGVTDASCSLTQDAGSLTANCRRQRLTRVPQDLPAGVTHLYLQNNKITAVHLSDFSQYGNLTNLDLDNNNISDIQAGTFNSTPQLRELHLYQNKLTRLRSDMFTGLGNLDSLWLDNNEISDIEAGTFNPTLELRTLHLQHNRLTVLNAEIFAKLSSTPNVNIGNNPWQCDCRMRRFRQNMNGTFPFEKQITCKRPSNFHGRKLEDISPKDLICEGPTILSFGKGDNTAVAEGGTLHLVCEASGIPTPDITVTLPSGLNVTVESGGRVTVDVNGTITITNFTAAADAGLYICTASSFSGSTSGTLSVDVHNLSVDVHLNMDFNWPSTDHSGHVKRSLTTHIFTLPVLVGSVCVCGSVLLLAIVVRIWRKKRSKTIQKRSNPGVHFSNTNVTATVATRAQNHGRQGAIGTDEEYDYAMTPSRRPQTSTGHRQHLGRHRLDDKYEVIPPDPPPRSLSCPPAADQNRPAAVHGADTPQYNNRHVRAAASDTEPAVHVIMDADDYLSFVVGPVKDGPQSHKYSNGHVPGASTNVRTVPPVILYENEDEDESVRVKNNPGSYIYENSHATTAAKYARAVHPVISYENDDKSVSGNNGPQTDRYEKRHVPAAALHAGIDEQLLMGVDEHLSFVGNGRDTPEPNRYLNRDTPEPNRYQNREVIAAAKDAVAVPRVIRYENGDE